MTSRRGDLRPGQLVTCEVLEVKDGGLEVKLVDRRSPARSERGLALSVMPPPRSAGLPVFWGARGAAALKQQLKIELEDP